MLRVFVTHNPEDCDVYYGRAMPALAAIDGVDVVRNPIHATGVGLLLYARDRARRQGGEPALTPGMRDVWARMKSWFQGNF